MRASKREQLHQIYRHHQALQISLNIINFEVFLLFMSPKMVSQLSDSSTECVSIICLNWLLKDWYVLCLFLVSAKSILRYLHTVGNGSHLILQEK